MSEKWAFLSGHYLGWSHWDGYH